MDNVLTSLIVLDGQGGVSEYVGGYSDWVARGGKLGDALSPDGASASGDGGVTVAAGAAAPGSANQSSGVPAGTDKKTSRKKLSYKELRELAALPAEIERLEARQAAMSAEMQKSDFYSRTPAQIAGHAQSLAELHEELEQAIERWSELEARA